MKKLTAVLVLLLHFTLTSYTQSEETKEVSIQFIPIWNAQILSPAFKDKGIQRDFDLELLKFYIGKITFYQDEEEVWTEAIYHLMDQSKSMKIDLTIPSTLAYNKMGFSVGVDSLTSISGAFNGDLDPINGMYWAWNSGYINIKLEGNKLASDGTSDNFQYHLGGYMHPFETANFVQFDIKEHEKIELEIDLSFMFQNFDLNVISKVMSPSESAVQLVEHFVKSISVYEK